jgi:hypothetical protein
MSRRRRGRRGAAFPEMELSNRAGKVRLRLGRALPYGRASIPRRRAAPRDSQLSYQLTERVDSQLATRLSERVCLPRCDARILPANERGEARFLIGSVGPVNGAG